MSIEPYYDASSSPVTLWSGYNPESLPFSSPLKNLYENHIPEMFSVIQREMYLVTEEVAKG